MRENILYSRPGASERKIIEAAENAHIHNFLCSSEEGYRHLVFRVPKKIP